MDIVTALSVGAAMVSGLSTLGMAGIAVLNVPKYFREKRLQIENEDKQRTLSNERKDRSLKEKQNRQYKELEFAAIDLFRFEARYPEAIAVFRNPQAMEYSEVDETGIRIYAYVYEMLCLFEMIVDFWMASTVDSEEFATWIEWFWETCEFTNFRTMWKKTIRNHYRGNISKILDAGVILAECEKNQDPHNFLEQLRRISYDMRVLGKSDEIARKMASEYSELFSYFENRKFRLLTPIDPKRSFYEYISGLLGDDQGIIDYYLTKDCSEVETFLSVEGEMERREINR